MKIDKQISYKVLGIAFIFQFFTSLISGAVIQSSWLVDGNIAQTLQNIQQNPAILSSNILLDMFTALGVIFLGVLLYLHLKEQNQMLALAGLSFYILEGSLLAVSRLATYALIPLSEEFVAVGSEGILPIAHAAVESMHFVGSTLHMLAFCFGAYLFYTLLFQSRLIPRWLSLWGLITLFPLLVGTFTAIYNFDLPFVLYVPYVPFELVAGIFFLFKKDS
ncbi:MAG: DUF4386 domain-containing protein [Anaerolineales bacterium]|nr:DUF4386 domain-containing protein [Anaerolineales bacterium]